MRTVKLRVLGTGILNTRKVHADASNFKDGLTKREVYAQVLEQAGALFDGQRNWVCLSFLAALNQRIR
jgi:hypothetical protein